MGWQADSPVPPGESGRAEIAGHCLLPDPRKGTAVRRGRNSGRRFAGSRHPADADMATARTTAPSYLPSPGRRPRKTAVAGLSRQRPGSSGSARPCPAPGCVMGNVVHSAPAAPRGGGAGRRVPAALGRGLTWAGAVSLGTAFSRHLLRTLIPTWTADPIPWPFCPSQLDVYLKGEKEMLVLLPSLIVGGRCKFEELYKCH